LRRGSTPSGGSNDYARRSEPLRIIIAGSRHLDDHGIVCGAMSEFVQQLPYSLDVDRDEFVSGGAAGVDRHGELWARRHGYRVRVFPADWELYGKAAGPIRNRRMAEYATHLVAIWDGESRGTASMILEASLRGLSVHVHMIGKENGL
jgi:hypothetical protein